MCMRNKLIQRLQINLKSMGLQNQKEAIYSSYGVTSSKEMTIEQLCHLISRLDSLAKKQQQTIQTNRQNDPEIRQWRSNCLVIITGRMRFPSNEWTIINSVVKSPRFGNGKILSQMTLEELKAVHKRLLMALSKGYCYSEWVGEQNKTQNSFMIVTSSNHKTIVN